MPWTDLPTNFKNLVWSGLKKYIKFDNPDQTVSFEDVTEYEDTDNTQMSAEQLNQMTDAINQMMDGDLFYSKSEVDTKLAGKASSTHNHDSVYLKLIRVASDFSTSQSYTVGDYVIYNGYICRFITDHPAGAWVTSHVSVVTVTDELKRKADTADLGDLAEKDKADWDTDIDNIPTSFPPESHNHDDRYYTETETDDLLDTKQDTLTFDTTPTASSTNPVTSGGIKTVLDDKADVITTSASGNPVTITDGSPAPVVDLTVGIEPVQSGSGDPSPSNIRPITGWTGCNVVKSRVFTPNQFVKNGNFESTTDWSGLKSTISVENNILKIQGDGSNATNGCYQRLNSIDPIGHIFFVTCDAKADVANIDCNIGLNYGSNSNNLILSNNKTLTTSWQTLCGIREFGEHSTYGFGFRFIGVSPNRIPDDSYAYVKNVMIIDLTEMFGEQVAEQILAMEQTESGSGIAVVKGFFPEEYYPTNNDTSPENDGQGSLYSITFPTEAGTVYGGSLDVTTGVLTVNKIIRQVLSTFDWKLGTNTNPNGTGFYAENIMSDCTNWQSSICNVFAVGSGTQGNTPNNTFWFLESNGTLRIFWGLPNKGSTVEEFTTFLQANPTYICAKLATPVTYQLTPVEVTTLLGENTISADTGAIDITYRADTKTYIDQKIAESQRATRSLIAGIETEMTATKNYSIGDLLIVGDTLYKVTANIAITGEITVGTNVTATTVAEQLILLANV